MVSILMYENCRSALMHLYRMSKYEVEEEFDTKLKQFMNGMKRTLQQQKVIHGDDFHEGKRKMSFEVYEKMCELFLKEESKEYLFAHCFLVLEWNLMARSENVVDCHVSHIYWSNDSLVFHFAKTKSDQTGKNTDQVWHVYATPENPCTCPILALACYLFSNPGVLTDGAAQKDKPSISLVGDGEVVGKADAPILGRLFPGEFQYDRFSRLFNKIIEKHATIFVKLGVEIGDLGSHSACKGEHSYSSSGSTVYPTITSICLRAMWSMVNAKNRYLQYEKAGDQNLGQVVSGLNVNTGNVSVSPFF